VNDEATGKRARRAADRNMSANRREFLARIPAAAALTVAGAAVPFGSSAEAGRNPPGGFNGAGNERVADSFQVRLDAALSEAAIPIPKQATNQDEQNYPNFIGNFSKGLPHNSIGEVNRSAYLSFLNAVSQGTAAAFEKVPLSGNVLLVNPLAGLAFDLEGTDSHQFAIPAFPSVASRELAAQAVELYWMALCRDLNFTDYGSSPLAQAAAAELSSLPGFPGPKSAGLVTPQTLFRGFTAADVIGPYVSQLLLSPFSYGPYAVNGKMSMYFPGIDYMTDQASWLAVQNGQGPFAQNEVDPVPRYIRNGRDYAMFVHTDPLGGLFMSFYNAGMVLFQNGAPLNPGNPYRDYKKQSSFGTFGVPFFLAMMGEVAARAFKAAWYAKWFVHRALRPEAFGGLVHMTKSGQAHYPLQGDVLNSAALANIFAQKPHTYFLPQAFPEGSPQHPSYPEGHATMAGACATILKAAFDGSVPYTELPRNGAIVTASPDGTALVPYTGADAGRITVNGEINKLASNIGQARNFAGIHWRSDADYGMLLGEAVALSILADQSNNYPGENFKEFTITKFDETTVTV
jgi:membrane-associated phospholipid phosphatase